MRKTICIITILIVCTGLAFALELKNSTFIGGVSYDYITGEGKGFDEVGAPFSTTVAGLSVYGGYDVQVGNIWFTRLEYELLVLPTTFDFKGDPVTKSDGYKLKGSKKRFGGYIVLNVDKNIKVNLGGVVTNVTMGITGSGDKFSLEYVQDLIGVGLVIEGQYDMGKHFTARFGIVPDFTFLTIDRYDLNYSDEELSTRKVSYSRSHLFALGFSISARMGVSSKF